MSRKSVITVCFMLAVLSSQVWGYWKEGDPYNMQNLQLPTGSVAPSLANIDVIADDWMSLHSGPVNDVHIFIGCVEVPIITNVQLSIYSSTVGFPSETAGQSYAMPDQILWSRDFSPGQFVHAVPFLFEGDPPSPLPPNIIPYGEGHEQISITGIEDPFNQEEGTVYWLGVSVTVIDDMFGSSVLWRSTQEQHNSPAVGGDGESANWTYLTGLQSGGIDMAFVIVPEPMTISLLALGGLAVIRRRK